MPDAKICVCGHVASNHKTKKHGGYEYFECLYDDCDCQKFNHIKTMNPARVNYANA